MFLSRRSPRLARLLLERSLPSDVREGVSGDLEELFERDRAEAGAFRARLRYWRRAMAVAGRFSAERVRGDGTGRPRASWLDVKLGLRMLVRYPGLTLVGGFGIAVGIAIATGSFSFFHANLYPTLPLPDGDRLVALENWNVEINNEDRRSLHDFDVWRRELTSVQEIGAFRTVEGRMVVPGGTTENVEIAQITAAGLRASHVLPLMGRALVDADEREGAPPVLLVGYDAWRTRFSSDPNVVGREVRIDGAVHTLIGVMPERFAFPMDHGFWTPLRADPAAARPGQGPDIFVFGRLAPGATIEAARTELAAIGQRMASASPGIHRHLRPQVLPYTYALIDIQELSAAPGMYLGMTQLFMSLVLLVVCVNVAVLVYARTATRHGEIAVRAALGASRGRIVGQLFVEALVLAAGPAIAGLALGQFGYWLGMRILENESGGRPFWTNQGIAPVTILYLAGMTLLVAVIVGVLPALQATGRRLQSGLRELGGGTKARLGRTWTVLIVAQVAIAVAALPAVAIMALQEVPRIASRPTFPADEFLLLSASAPAASNAEADDPVSRRERAERFARFQADVRGRLAAEAAVVSTTWALTITGGVPSSRIEIEGAAPGADAAGRLPRVARVAVDFFTTVGAAPVAGRTFTPADASASVAVVNQTFARRVLGEGNPIGRRLRYVPPGGGPPGAWQEVVGVVADLEANAVDSDLDTALAYHPVAPGVSPGGLFLVRVRGGDPGSFAARVREVAAAVDPSIQVGRIIPLENALSEDGLALALVGLVFGLVAATVLLLSAAGVYAMMSFAVTQRRREIGIRTALGADARQVLRSIFGQAVRQLSLGIMAGGVLVIALDRVLQEELLEGMGLILLPVMAAVMLGVGLLAAYGPARRALGIQPTVALREE